MANNFRVHTDANYRIRDDIAPLMQSSRYFNKNNCMASRSLRRNIISDSFVQPYTKNFDDGSCDYNIARESDLKIGNHGYYSRPQNYESQLGLTEANMKATNANSKLDQAYNLVGGDLPSINSTQRQTYYPYAFGGDLNNKMGSGVMGNFAPHEGNVSGKPSGYYEPYAYRKAGTNAQMNKILRTGESNFGNFKPKYELETMPTHAGYDASRLEHLKVNPAARSYATSSPKFNKYQEQFTVQHQPREGFFFESSLYPGNNLSPDYDSLGDMTIRTSTSLQKSIDDLNALITQFDEKTVKLNARINSILGNVTGAARATAVSNITSSISSKNSAGTELTRQEAEYQAFTREIASLAIRKVRAQAQITTLSGLKDDPDQNLTTQRSAADQAILDANKLL